MNSHKNARLTLHGRILLIDRVLTEGLRPAEVAQAQGVSVRTVYKWLARYQSEGEAGLHNRSCRPHRCPHAIAGALRDRLIEHRRQRHTYRQIATTYRISCSTVARIVQRAGLNRLAALQPPRAHNRYEHAAPGDLLHLDIKKLGRFERPGHRVCADPRQKSRGAGWEYVHVGIDDHSRVAFSSIEPDESGRSACRALVRALRYYRTLGVRFRRVLTDNGACYKSRRFRRLCQRLGLKHLRTKPYSPQTNGKAERFIQTALREWAYARAYDNSEQRGAYLHHWLHQYNWHRPHASIDYLPPVSRLGLSVNNLLGLHS